MVSVSWELKARWPLLPVVKVGQLGTESPLACWELKARWPFAVVRAFVQKPSAFGALVNKDV